MQLRCPPERASGLRALLTPCNLIYGAIAIATAIALLSSLAGLLL